MAPKSKRRKIGQPVWQKSVPVRDLGRGTTFLDLPFEIRQMIYSHIEDPIGRLRDTRCLSNWLPTRILLVHPQITYEILAYVNERHKFALKESLFSWMSLELLSYSELVGKNLGARARSFLDPRSTSAVAALRLPADAPSPGSSRAQQETAPIVNGPHDRPQLKHVEIHAPGLCKIAVKVTREQVSVTKLKTEDPEGRDDMDRWERMHEPAFKFGRLHLEFTKKLQNDLQQSVKAANGYGLSIDEICKVIAAVKVFHHEIAVKLEEMATATDIVEASAAFMEDWLFGPPKATPSGGAKEVDEARATGP